MFERIGTGKAEAYVSCWTYVYVTEQRHAKVELKIAGTPASVYCVLAEEVRDGLAALLDTASGR